MKGRKRNRKYDNERIEYFRKQKLIGIVLILCAAAVCFFGAVAESLVFSVPGLVLIFSKKALIVDDYYWENSDLWVD